MSKNIILLVILFLSGIHIASASEKKHSDAETQVRKVEKINKSIKRSNTVKNNGKKADTDIEDLKSQVDLLRIDIDKLSKNGLSIAPQDIEEIKSLQKKAEKSSSTAQEALDMAKNGDKKIKETEKVISEMRSIVTKCDTSVNELKNKGLQLRSEDAKRLDECSENVNKVLGQVEKLEDKIKALDEKFEKSTTASGNTTTGLPNPNNTNNQSVITKDDKEKILTLSKAGSMDEINKMLKSDALSKADKRIVKDVAQIGKQVHEGSLSEDKAEQIFSNMEAKNNQGNIILDDEYIVLQEDNQIDNLLQEDGGLSGLTQQSGTSNGDLLDIDNDTLDGNLSGDEISIGGLDWDEQLDNFSLESSSKTIDSYDLMLDDVGADNGLEGDLNSTDDNLNDSLGGIFDTDFNDGLDDNLVSELELSDEKTSKSGKSEDDFFSDDSENNELDLMGNNADVLGDVSNDNDFQTSDDLFKSDLSAIEGDDDLNDISIDSHLDLDVENTANNNEDLFDPENGGDDFQSLDGVEILNDDNKKNSQKKSNTEKISVIDDKGNLSKVTASELTDSVVKIVK